MEWNNLILCVDDDEGILEAYLRALPTIRHGAHDTHDLMERRQRRKKDVIMRQADEVVDIPCYEIVTATSGEEAMEIVRGMMAQGRQIAIGFFDMIMPGGMDGMETIRQVRLMDSQMLCAVVTAYTDRSPEQIGKLFPRRDDWLYFNKPFSSGELTQTAHHLVTAWNQRRKEEILITNMQMMKNGLLAILDTVSDINCVPPMVMDTMLEGILDHYMRLVDGEDGFITMRTARQRTIQLGRGKWKVIDDFSSDRFPAQKNLARKAMDGEKAIVSGTMAAAPLKKDEEVLGVLIVETPEPIKIDPMLLDMFASQAVNMIEYSNFFDNLGLRNLELSSRNQELLDLFQKITLVGVKDALEGLICQDILTRIANRRAFEIRFQEELTRCRRHRLAIACLIINIDHFKDVNEEYGTNASDYVLREMAHLLGRRKRPYDFIARYGGDEFAVLFMHMEKESAELVAERIRKAIAEHSFFFEGRLMKITVSIGLAVVRPSSAETMESVMEIANKALQQAKLEGRNRYACRYYDARIAQKHDSLRG